MAAKDRSRRQFPRPRSTTKPRHTAKELIKMFMVLTVAHLNSPFRGWRGGLMRRKWDGNKITTDFARRRDGTPVYSHARFGQGAQNATEQPEGLPGQAAEAEDQKGARQAKPEESLIFIPGRV